VERRVAGSGSVQHASDGAGGNNRRPTPRPESPRCGYDNANQETEKRQRNLNDGSRGRDAETDADDLLIRLEPGELRGWDFADDFA